jgi:multicomponent Na+:H+ antiporter subunit E
MGVYFLWNIMLAFSWAFMSGKVTPGSLGVGFVLGFIILAFLRGSDSETHSDREKFVIGMSLFPKAFRALGFSLWFAKELIVTNLRVAKIVVWGWQDSCPGTVAIPLHCETDLEITMLANLITLTPGTLSIDVSDDRETLYIHALFIDTPDAVRAEIKEGLERRLLEVMR